MRLVLGSLFALIVAAAIGLGTTWLVLTEGTAYGGVTVGAWTAWPKNGTPGIDPYARAMVARSGELPIGSGDGIAFYARSDDAGYALDGRCETLLRGVTPAARFWTLTLYDPEGRLVANSASRYGFTSQEITRFSDGSFQIMVAPRARPGNWLPSGGADRYVLVLRLYDTPVGAATRIGREAHATIGGRLRPVAREKLRLVARQSRVVLLQPVGDRLEARIGRELPVIDQRVEPARDLCRRLLRALDRDSESGHARRL